MPDQRNQRLSFGGIVIDILAYVGHPHLHGEGFFNPVLWYPHFLFLTLMRECSAEGLPSCRCDHTIVQ